MKVKEACELAINTTDPKIHDMLFEHPSKTVRSALLKNQYLNDNIIEDICESLNANLVTKRGRSIPRTNVYNFFAFAKLKQWPDDIKHIMAMALARHQVNMPSIVQYRTNPISTILMLYGGDIIPDEVITLLASGKHNQQDIKILTNKHHLLSINARAKLGLLNIRHSIKEANRAIHFSDDEQELLLLANDPRDDVIETMCLARRVFPKSVQMILVKTAPYNLISDMFILNIESFCEDAQIYLIDRTLKKNSKGAYYFNLDKIFVNEKVQLHLISVIEKSNYDREYLFRQMLKNKALSEQAEMVIKMMNIVAT